MKKIDLGQALQIFANLAVVAGIVFLAIEVRQNQESLEESNTINIGSVVDGALDSFNAHRTLIVQDEQLAQIWLSGSSGASLSAVEAVRFYLLCQNLMWTYATAYERFLSLGRESAARGAVTSLHRRIANNPGLKKCWDDNEQSMLEWDYLIPSAMEALD